MQWQVAFADTDAGGVVYHTRYLEWAERARSQWLHSLGTSNSALQQQGIVFAVRRLQAEFLRAARLDDTVEIVTQLQQVAGARLHLLQVLRLGASDGVRLQVELACLTLAGKPQRLPPSLHRLLLERA